MTGDITTPVVVVIGYSDTGSPIEVRKTDTGWVNLFAEIEMTDEEMERIEKYNRHWSDDPKHWAIDAGQYEPA